jgi:hypothetical protein
VPSPVLLQDRVHPLVSFASSSEYSAVTCPLPESSGRLPWGFFSSSRQQRMESTYHRASHARLCFALSVSHALSDLLLRAPCGLISSHYHVQDSRFRGFPRCQAGSPHRRVVPSWRWRVSPRGELPRRCQFHPPQLQGLNPSSDPLRPTGGLDLPFARSPPGLSTLSGLSPAALETPSRPLRS